MIKGLHTAALATVLLLCGSLAADESTNDAKSDLSESDRHIVMHKNPGCSCCELWADHLRQHGFDVDVNENPKLYDLKEITGIPQPLFSCHTAFVGKYFIEGHVPAKDILSLLELKPEGVSGIAVPGMPLGSPGMEHPSPQTFNTIALTVDGDAYIYAKHEAGENFSTDAD